MYNINFCFLTDNAEHGSIPWCYAPAYYKSEVNNLAIKNGGCLWGIQNETPIMLSFLMFVF